MSDNPQKDRMEEIWQDRGIRHPCNWTRWTKGDDEGLNEGAGLYSSKGQLTYPVYRYHRR